MSNIGEVTRLLEQASAGDADARATLFDVLYRELRRLAEAAMRAERVNHTLQPKRGNRLTESPHHLFNRYVAQKRPQELPHFQLEAALPANRG